MDIDSSGNIAVANAPYALAQDAASAIQTYLGEVYFNTTLGIPYLTSIFGQNGVPVNLLRSQCETAALTVPGIESVQVFFTQLTQRTLVGQVQITDNLGNTIAVGISFSNNGTFTLDQSTLDGPNLLG